MVDKNFTDDVPASFPHAHFDFRTKNRPALNERPRIYGNAFWNYDTLHNVHRASSLKRRPLFCRTCVRNVIYPFFTADSILHSRSCLFIARFTVTTLSVLPDTLPARASRFLFRNFALRPADALVVNTFFSVTSRVSISREHLKFPACCLHAAHGLH